MILVHKGVAHPWQCDVLGHLTTRFYVAMFDDSSYFFLHDVFGWTGAQNDDNTIGWVDVRHVINYQAEVAAGDLLEVRAKLTKVGGKSITAMYEMSNVGSGEISATFEVIYVLFDLRARKAVALNDELRATAENAVE